MSPLADLIEALQKPQVWPHTATKVEVVETHISYVLLVGEFAYKIKKPVNLGFLDFSSLELRQACCEKELVLNQRLAPDIYLDVVTITNGISGPEIGGAGRALEYAVRMRRFPENGLLSQHVERLTPELVDALAREVAEFHAGIEIAAEGSDFGSPETVYAPMQENLQHILVLEHEPEIALKLKQLQQWTGRSFSDLTGTIVARKASGFVRACHGDMHLGNITLINEVPVLFDGIEFNDDLRWIDLISEIAFLVMDVEERGRPELAQRFLNTYLEETGDYDGLELLNFYKVYRALVRAKVAAIRLRQDDLEESDRFRVEKELHAYIDLALSYTRPGNPAIIITHGYSGSGKSFSARLLSMLLPAIQIRSDVERKRISGFGPDADTHSPPWDGIYGDKSTWDTYQRLLDLSEDLAAYGFVVIVDATFLKLEQRQLFSHMAERMLVPFLILDMQEDAEVLHDRVRERGERGAHVSEADEEILDAQLKCSEPLTSTEKQFSMVVSSKYPLSIQGVKKRLYKSLSE